MKKKKSTEGTEGKLYWILFNNNFNTHTEKKRNHKCHFIGVTQQSQKIRSKHSAQIIMKIIISTSNVITWKLLGHY